jgi:hypothetical protein
MGSGRTRIGSVGTDVGMPSWDMGAFRRDVHEYKAILLDC